MIKHLPKQLLPVVVFLVFCYITVYSFGQLKPRKKVTVDLIKEITPQSDTTKFTNFKLNRIMDDLLSYAQKSVNPMKRDMRTDAFLDRYLPYYEFRMLRNGDIAYLRFYYDKYLKTLEECLALARPHQLEFQDTRSIFFKKATLPTRKEKRKYWRRYSEKRNELIGRFFDFRQYLIPALSTEICMIMQEEHFPELAAVMNDLPNLDGSAMEVTVFSNLRLNFPEMTKRQIAGLSIISKCQDVYTSGSPAIRNAFPGLRGSNKGLAVHLQLFEDGVTLSHELGHLYYLYHKWDEYVVYIQEKGKDYEPGGHGLGDPSGEAAFMTEQGIMPF
ncbi:MAG: hypothetical protein AAF960_28205 [Bacteroidota bacterium]